MSGQHHHGPRGSWPICDVRLRRQTQIDDLEFPPLAAGKRLVLHPHYSTHTCSVVALITVRLSYKPQASFRRQTTLRCHGLSARARTSPPPAPPEPPCGRRGSGAGMRGTARCSRRSGCTRPLPRRSYPRLATAAGRSNRVGAGVDQVDPLPGGIDEHLLAGRMRLPHQILHGINRRASVLGDDTVVLIADDRCLANAAPRKASVQSTVPAGRNADGEIPLTTAV
jgi:hypothetical protein